MTAEAYWYASYVDGRAPTIRMIPWRVRVHPDTPRRLALAFGAGDGYGYLHADPDGYGRAGYRPVGPADPRLWDHQIWYWHDAPMPGVWHYIPVTIASRAMRLREIATAHAVERGRGSAPIDDIIAVLADRDLLARLEKWRAVRA